MTEQDKYVVYHGIEDGAATFGLYDDEGAVRRVTMSPDEVPAGTEIGDHFWVELNEDSEISKLKFDSEFTDKKQEQYQEAVDKFKQMQEMGRQKMEEDNGD